jgi:hypothetical protein
MATLDQIDINQPLVIEAAKYEQDQHGVNVRVSGDESIVLIGEDAFAFYAWVMLYWQSEFERDLQGLVSSAINGPMLSASMPLVTFREDICCRALPNHHKTILALMERLRVLTREWSAAGVDTVYFHGYRRQDTAGLTNVPVSQQIQTVEVGGALILPARRPDDYRSPRTRDAWNECIDETIQLNGHLAQMAANARRYEKIRALVGKDQLTLSIDHDCYTQYVDSGEELDSSIDRLVDAQPAPADVDDQPGQPYKPAKDMRAADWAAVLPSSALPASDLVAIEALSWESNAQ